MQYVVRLHFLASKNMAEYEALLSGLCIAIELGIKRLDVRGDSQLVIDQVMKEASCHDDKMEAYCNAVHRLEDKYNETSSVDEAEAIEIHEAPPLRDWCAQYLDWMIRGVLPSDHAQARRIARQAKSFVLIDDELYKHSPSGILQRCIPIPEGKELIRDIHAGICGHHAAPRTLVGNTFRQGFYWPTAVANTTDAVRTCESCQFYAQKMHLPAHALQTIPIT